MSDELLAEGWVPDGKVSERREVEETRHSPVQNELDATWLRFEEVSERGDTFLGESLRCTKIDRKSVV